MSASTNARMNRYHEIFDRLDRLLLLDLMRPVFPALDEDYLRSLTRTEMIDALLDAQAEARVDARDEGDRYPLRRPELGASAPDGRLFARRSKVHVIWQGDWEPAAWALATDISDNSWRLSPVDIQPGDHLITALGSEPALVAALEVVHDVSDANVTVGPSWVFAAPVAVTELEARSDARLPHRTHTLDDVQADAVLTVLRELVETPAPIFVTAGACGPGHVRSGTAVHVTRILQDGAAGADGERCTACETSTDATELHYFRPVPEDIQLEIQDHVDEAVLLCSDCHALCHSPSLTRLRGAARPGCPRCGARWPREIRWGDVGPEAFKDDDVIPAGCAIPPGIVPRWQCRECDTAYAVVPVPGDGEILPAPGEIWGSATGRG